MFDCRIDRQPVPDDILAPYRDSTESACDGDELRQRFEQDGYIFVRGVVPPSDVQAARDEVFGRLAEVEEIAEPPGEGIFTGHSRREELQPDKGAFWQSVSEGPAIRRVTHAPGTEALISCLQGEPAFGHDFIFLRPGVPGRFTFLHFDYPFFSRGSQRVVTAWTAVGPVPTIEGALFIVENSRTFEDLLKDTREIDYNSAASPQVQLTGDAVEFARSRGSKILTANFEPGDVIVFGMFTMHGSFDNASPINRTRLTTDVRWQPRSEPADERYIGLSPKGTTGIGYAELNGAKPLTQNWHVR
ncbi:MAG: phytanoyl-CoA dioxygenase family protein [Planctomycetota bacterium]|nr:phytanoyl-CoA dioxygenase family protein [Planctomycetota bacterium]